MWYLPGKLFILSNIILNAQFQAHHNHNCAHHVMQQSHESEPVDPPCSLREATQVEIIGQTVLWSLASTYFSNLTNASLIVTHHLYLPSPQYSINILLQGPQVQYVPQETLASLQLMLPLPLLLLLALPPSPFIVVSYYCIDTTDELTWALA